MLFLRSMTILGEYCIKHFTALTETKLFLVNWKLYEDDKQRGNWHRVNICMSSHNIPDKRKAMSCQFPVFSSFMMFFFYQLKGMRRWQEEVYWSMCFATCEKWSGCLDLAVIASRADVYLMCLSFATCYLYTFQAKWKDGLSTNRICGNLTFNMLSCLSWQTSFRLLYYFKTGNFVLYYTWLLPT